MGERALHLILMLLTGEPRDVEARERADCGGRRPSREAAFAGQLTRAAEDREPKKSPFRLAMHRVVVPIGLP